MKKDIILYIIIAVLLCSTVALLSLFLMQKEVINDYKEIFIKEHFNENGQLISQESNINEVAE